MEPDTQPRDHDATFAVIDLLLTVGYIDGLLHDNEQLFIKSYMDRLVEQMAKVSGTHDEWRVRFDQVYAHLDHEMTHIAAEIVAAGDDRYKATRLKVRAVALFRAFSPADQAVALGLLDIMMQVDGTIAPAEQELRDELLTYFNARPTLPIAAQPEPIEAMEILPVGNVPLVAPTHPWLDPVEQTYSNDPATLHQQVTADYTLIFAAITVWEQMRAKGTGRLFGVTDIAQLPLGTQILDGHIHVMRPDHPTELVVLGDLHGCYACFKAALLQSNFIERALAHKADPVNNPDIKLVLLGDYIDRGLFSFAGVVRAALQLLVALPDHVIMLRGNHEFFVRVGDQIKSAVNPAEALPAIQGKVPFDVVEAYRHLFEHMPTSFVFDRTLFVHGGIPRDETIAERFNDLSSLEDTVVRFEMMWSDPVQTDRVPPELQRESPRFNFGREQFRAFMEKIGCHTLIRGHEQVDVGFTTTFDIGHRRLHTLFSAGGHDNSDLPAESRYRKVAPSALTIRSNNGISKATPWPIDYKPFNGPANNGLYRS